MSNDIQSIRNIYSIAKSARDKGAPFTDDEIKSFLERTVSDASLIENYSRFAKGYAAEDLFMRIYSLLPWVKSVVPLGQEQFPEKSKEELQISDYEMIFEAGNAENTSTALVEVKLVDGDKQTFDLEKYKYNVLKEYALQKNEPLLFGLFWRKQCVWTINSIESFSEKSSSYKISYHAACLDDLSAVFGDYTYVFRKPCFRKCLFSKAQNPETPFFHSHERFGCTMYEGISLDKNHYAPLNEFEPAFLDCAFDFKKISSKAISDTDTELVEQLVKMPYVYKLSSLLFAYLAKLYCIDANDMYYNDNILVQKSFCIVDAMRQKCGGERCYQVPWNTDPILTRMMKIQFDGTRIFRAYQTAERIRHYRIICSHE